MKRSWAVLVTMSGVGVLLLWGQARVDAAGATPGYAGKPECKNPRGLKYTAPIGAISVSGGTLSVSPDPVVQPQAAGFLGWRMAAPQKADSFRVTFKNDDSPLPDATYTSEKGHPVGAVVRPDADCKHYEYSVTVWPAGGGAPVTVDPGSDIVP
ncbi:MAG TPA: hypothetical protein VKA44_04355 [Gemmatimonadota bacterium]|nr:hypothetical protein [Gemmatimonadota bacterium]